MLTQPSVKHLLDDVIRESWKADAERCDGQNGRKSSDQPMKRCATDKQETIDGSREGEGCQLE
jgi:hypothetical protein